MDWKLTVASGLIAALALVHSILGERAIIARLMRRDQPKLFGSDDFTKRTLRFAWHALTVSWFGLAAIVGWLATALLDDTGNVVLTIIAGTLVAVAVLTVVVSRAKHLSWVVELVVAALIVAAIV